MFSARNVWVAVFMVIWILGVITWGFGMYHMIKAQRGYRGDRRWTRWMLGGAVFFFPQFFTDEGNRHRVRMLLAVAIFVCLVAAGFGMSLFIEK